mgnify:CR=1 FL=1
MPKERSLPKRVGDALLRPLLIMFPAPFTVPIWLVVVLNWYVHVVHRSKPWNQLILTLGHGFVAMQIASYLQCVLTHPGSPTEAWKRAAESGEYPSAQHPSGALVPPRGRFVRKLNAVILHFDHHCWWIGAAIGRRNRKFFLLFLFWSAVLAGFGFAVSMCASPAESRPCHSASFRLDPPLIRVAVSARYDIFHAWLPGAGSLLAGLQASNDKSNRPHHHEAIAAKAAIAQLVERFGHDQDEAGLREALLKSPEFAMLHPSTLLENPAATFILRLHGLPTHQFRRLCYLALLATADFAACILLSAFAIWHLKMVWRNQTTLGPVRGAGRANLDRPAWPSWPACRRPRFPRPLPQVGESDFNVGAATNLRQVFGSRRHLWLLPVWWDDTPAGDGLHWPRREGAPPLAAASMRSERQAEDAFS